MANKPGKRWCRRYAKKVRRGLVREDRNIKQQRARHGASMVRDEQHWRKR